MADILNVQFYTEAYGYQPNVNRAVNLTGAGGVVIIVSTTSSGIAGNPTVTIGGVTPTYLGFTSGPNSSGQLWAFSLLDPPTGAAVNVNITYPNTYLGPGKLTVIPIDSAADIGFFAANAGNTVATLSGTTVHGGGLIAAFGYGHYVNINNPTSSPAGITTVASDLSDSTHTVRVAELDYTGSGQAISITFTSPFNVIGACALEIAAAGGPAAQSITASGIASSTGFGTPGVAVAPGFPGYTYDFIETWDGYAAGNTFTQLDAAYSRNSVHHNPILNADAAGPEGLVLTPAGTLQITGYIERDDIFAALGGGGTIAEFHASFRRPNADASVRHGFGSFGALTSNFWGVVSKYTSGPRHDIVYQNNGSLTSGGTLLFANTTNDISHVRIQYDFSGTPTMRIKAWADGGPEPGSWGVEVAMAGAPGSYVTHCVLSCYRDDLSTAGGVLWYGVILDDGPPPAQSIIPAGISSSTNFGMAGVGFPGPTGPRALMGRFGGIGGSPLSSAAIGAIDEMPSLQSLAPAGISSSTSFGMAGLGVGPVVLEPAGIAPMVALGAPAVVPGGVSAAPPGIPSSTGFGQSALFPGPVVLACNGIPGAGGVGTPVVAPGTVTITPSGLASGAGLGQPLVDSDEVVVTPSGIAATGAVGIPNLSETIFGSVIDGFGISDILTTRKLAPRDLARQLGLGDVLATRSLRDGPLAPGLGLEDILAVHRLVRAPLAASLQLVADATIRVIRVASLDVALGIATDLAALRRADADVAETVAFETALQGLKIVRVPLAELLTFTDIVVIQTIGPALWLVITDSTGQEILFRDTGPGPDILLE